MPEFQADIFVDAFNPQQAKSLRKKLDQIADATIFDVNEYRETEKTFFGENRVLQGFRFSLTFSLVKMPTGTELRDELDRRFLDRFEGAKEISFECYCLDPDPPELNEWIRHPRYNEQVKRENARLKAWREKEQAKRRKRDEKVAARIAKETK